ncbi:MAG: zinc-binding dehydrogenase [Candidatus Kapabacteria bacterium]|nr:zinc-binding dehydrogenase [Candidatus Kapabacteria bacterium]
MQAFVLRSISPLEYGIEDIPQPPLADGYARVRLHAAALNHRDVWITKGQYAKIELPVVLGSDGVGEIVEVNSETDGLTVGTYVLLNPNINWGGDERTQSKSYSILGMPQQGTLAEYISVPLNRIHRVPSHLSSEQAAALPLAGLTAYRAVFTQGHCSNADTVLITGIGGGVALAALHFAVQSGARVYVTSSSEDKINRAVELGASGGFLYTDSEWTKQALSHTGGFDLCIDGAGGATMNQLLNVVNPGGRIVSYGATHGIVPDFDIRKVFWKQITLQGTTMGSDNDFASMLRYVGQHHIVPVIDSVIPFAETQRAFERMNGMAQFGKIVVSLR